MRLQGSAARVLPPLPSAQPKVSPAAPGSIIQHTARSGLRIVAVRRPSVPVVELRLAVPFAGSADNHAATAELLAAVLVGSSGGHDRTGLDAALGRAGGTLRTSVTPERLTVRGSFAADGLTSALAVLGEVLSDSRRPEDEVGTQRQQLTHRLRMYRSHPRTAAREALLEQCFPGHPMSREVPLPDAVTDVHAEHVAALHVRALVPRGSRLLLVGDLDPATAVINAEHALASWTAPHRALDMPDLPVPAVGVSVQGRESARQVQIRLLTAVPGRDEELYTAVRLANLVLGASFGSRLTARLRERDGLTYSVHTSVVDAPGRALMVLDSDTSPGQLGAALVATREELDRFANEDPPSGAEADAARNYHAGSLAIMLSSQNGTADLLHQLPPGTDYEEWLAVQPDLAGRAGLDEVRTAARRMAAACFSGVLLTPTEHVSRATEEAEAAGFTSAPALENCRS